MVKGHGYCYVTYLYYRASQIVKVRKIPLIPSCLYMGVMPEIVFRNVGNHRSVLPLGNLELKDLLHVHQVLRLCIADILHREFSYVENFTLIAIKLFMFST